MAECPTKTPQITINLCQCVSGKRKDAGENYYTTISLTQLVGLLNYDRPSVFVYSTAGKRPLRLSVLLWANRPVSTLGKFITYRLRCRFALMETTHLSESVFAEQLALNFVKLCGRHTVSDEDRKEPAVIR